MVDFIKKNWLIFVLLLFTGVLMYPPTGLPIKVLAQRLFMTSPSEISEEHRKSLSFYDWELDKIDGTSLNFNESEEKVVLLNFWATWCPPCVAELPSMQNLFIEYGDRVDFYFVTAEDPTVVKRFMEKKGFNLPIFIEKQVAPPMLRVNTIPTTFVLDKNGHIVIQETGAAKWDSDEVKFLFDNLIAE